MKILVTGATGFLGTNLVLQCLEQGHEVRAFGLPGSTTKYIEQPGVELTFGNVTDPTSVKLAVDGVDAVIHVAGDTSFWKKRFARQRQTNVEGPRTVMQAALDAGIRRAIHTSTVDTFGFNPNGLADESWAEFNYAGWGYNYAETKREGERIALSFNEQGLEVVVINPGSMIGPYDHTLQFGRLFLDIKNGNVPGIPPSGAPWAHVAEVAKAHIAALDKWRPGEKYICGGVNATYKEVFTLIAESIDLKPPKSVFPRWVSVLFGYLAEFGANFTGKPPSLNPGQARYMSAFPQYNSSKAIQELDFHIVPLHQMIADARDWYIENGFL
ncbi:MAG TPA: SDR family oxidoreductase [Candidatus Lokiarchaeia archaeon]|nr:SDR family oxidoreductase [Candidatus Lokiarchaeia archaeon]